MNTREQISEAEKALLFENRKSSVTRAAQIQRDVDLDNEMEGQLYAKSSATLDYSKTEPAFGVYQIPEIEDLALETRFVLLPESVKDPIPIFQQCVNFVYDATPNFTPIPEKMKVLGYVFEEVRFGEFSLQVFKHIDSLGLSCRLTDGFAPVLTPFWDNLKAHLTEKDLLEAEPQSDFEDDFDDFFDSDSTSELGLALDLTIPTNRFVNCSSDPELVIEWAEDIKDPNFAQDTLLIVSYNCGKPENLNYLMETFAQQLFEAVTYSMTPAMDMQLPAIRGASVFLNHVANNAKVTVTNEQLSAIISQLARWTLSTKSDTAVTRSIEIATMLSQNLKTFANFIEEPLSIERELLEAIAQECEFGNVKDDVERFLSSLS